MSGAGLRWEKAETPGDSLRGPVGVTTACWPRLLTLPGTPELGGDAHHGGGVHLSASRARRCHWEIGEGAKTVLAKDGVLVLFEGCDGIRQVNSSHGFERLGLIRLYLP